MEFKQGDAPRSLAGDPAIFPRGDGNNVRLVRRLWRLGCLPTVEKPSCVVARVLCYRLRLDDGYIRIHFISPRAPHPMILRLP